MLLPRTALAIALLAPAFSAETVPASENLTTHEWGTFTSVADEYGLPVPWAPLSGPADLPCFVSRLGLGNPKLAPGLVRMETPVLYFYPQREMTLSVHVDFPQGWITEWYPQARVRRAASSPDTTLGIGRGQIDWESVQLVPGTSPDLPTSKAASHYYAARNTDSAPLRIGEQWEKLLFYRGIANFEPPLRAKLTEEGKLELRNAGRESIPWAILFENRSGKMGYRAAGAVKRAVTLDLPELTGDLEDLSWKMVGTLQEFGLYRKEALAMVETWRDSWFDEGMRVFYIVPRTTVDSVLPLKITPAPTELVRVFVGRVEVLSPHLRQTIETALTSGDISTLSKFGRFLTPFVSQIQSTNRGLLQSRATEAYFRQAFNKVQQQFTTASCVQ